MILHQNPINIQWGYFSDILGLLSANFVSNTENVNYQAQDYHKTEWKPLQEPTPCLFFFLNSYSRRSPILWDNKLVISTLTQDVGNQGSFWTIRKGKISLAWSQGNWVTSVIWQGENRLKRDRQTDLHCIMREYFQIRQGRIKVITQATSITPAE